MKYESKRRYYPDSPFRRNMDADRIMLLLKIAGNPSAGGENRDLERDTSPKQKRS